MQISLLDFVQEQRMDAHFAIPSVVYYVSLLLQKIATMVVCCVQVIQTVQFTKVHVLHVFQGDVRLQFPQLLPARQDTFVQAPYPVHKVIIRTVMELIVEG